MTTSIFIVVAFFLSAFCGFIAIPLVLNFCKEKNLYDLPNYRKMHKNATPRLGGVSFLPSMLIAFLITMFFFTGYTGYSQVTFSLWSFYFFISLILVYGVGFIDDLIGLGAKTKFFVQILAASLMPVSGLYLNNLYGFLGIHEIPYAVGAPLTVFVIVFITNSINLIDGIDGLAAGVSIIALTGFLVCFVNEGLWLYGILISALIGILVPFLYYNVFGDPNKNRKIFMGDSGSLSLGFILGFLAVKYSMDNPAVMFWRPDCLLLAYTFLIVPCFDVVRVSLTRLIHRTPIFKADKNHLHHKLMRGGFSQHQATLSILALALFYVFLNCSLPCDMSSTVIVGLDIFIWIIVHQALNFAIRRNGQSVFQKNVNNE